MAFLFIYTILKSLFSGNNKIGSEFKTLITNTLIAGILIQASWFLTSAAVDLSTIATYGVGGLPITILGSSSDENLDLVYFNHERVINFEQQGDSFIQDFLILHTKDWNISPCATTSIQWKENDEQTATVILGRKIIAYQSRLA
ncbi:hypothetical protein J5893_02120 [bacterium]|nr:hypothetical protein [bacterium]